MNVIIKNDMSGGENGLLPASKYTQGNITCWSNTAVTYIGLLQLFCVDLQPTNSWGSS